MALALASPFLVGCGGEEKASASDASQEAAEVDPDKADLSLCTDKILDWSEQDEMSLDPDVIAVDPDIFVVMVGEVIKETDEIADLAANPKLVALLTSTEASQQDLADDVTAGKSGATLMLSQFEVLRDVTAVVEHCYLLGVEAN